MESAINQPPRLEFPAPVSALAEAQAMLAAIRQKHDRLTAEMATMDALTRETQPDRVRFSRVRWQLSYVSLARRTLSNRISDYLEPLVTPPDKDSLKALRTADRELARSSAAHIGRWSANMIDEQWPEYCLASRDIRSKMKAHLGMEQRLLFPLLERAARGAIGS